MKDNRLKGWKITNITWGPSKKISRKTTKKKSTKTLRGKQKSRISYCPNDMEKALDAIKSGMSIRQAQKKFNVPRSSLSYRIHNPDCTGRMGPKPRLGNEIENNIANWFRNSYQRGFSFTKSDILLSVSNYIPKRELSNFFTNGRPSTSWSTLFLQRHPELRDIIKRRSDVSKPTAYEQPIKTWFSQINCFLLENNLKHVISEPARVFNANEMSIQFCPKSGRFLKFKTDITANIKSAITVVLTFGANGDIVPPFVVVPNKKILEDVASTASPDWCVGLSESGCVKSKLFYDYIKDVFHPYLLRTQRKLPVIMFVNQMSLSLEVSELCQTIGIVLIALYPGATRLLHTCDCTSPSSFNIAWNKSMQEWERDNPHQLLTKYNFMPVLMEAVSYIEPSAIVAVFRETGLCPWNVRCL